MNLIVLTSVDSTNNYLQQLLEKEMAVEGTLVVALEQTMGRGQRGKSWDSRPGMGLYASILFQPQNWTVEKQFIMNKTIAVGVAAYLESKTDHDVQIKWPNDVLIDGSKVAGILVENSIRGNYISAVIAGIGINLNQPEFQQQFETPATSLRLITGNTYDVEAEAVELFRFVWNAYSQLNAGERETLENQYAHRLYRRGERAAFTRGQGIFFGVLESVDDFGQAIILEEGRPVKCSHPLTRFYFPSKS